MTKISKGTIIRTALLILALANQALTARGWSPLPFEDDDVTEVVSTAVTVGAAVAAWWKNNSFSSAAVEADKTMRKLKKVR